MTQTFDLNKMGLMELSQNELINTDGGTGFWDAVVGWAVGKILDNAPQILQGTQAFAAGAYSGSQVGGGIFYK